MQIAKHPNLVRIVLDEMTKRYHVEVRREGAWRRDRAAFVWRIDATARALKKTGVLAT